MYLSLRSCVVVVLMLAPAVAAADVSVRVTGRSECVTETQVREALSRWPGFDRAGQSASVHISIRGNVAAVGIEQPSRQLYSEVVPIEDCSTASQVLAKTIAMHVVGARPDPTPQPQPDPNAESRPSAPASATPASFDDKVRAIFLSQIPQTKQQALGIRITLAKQERNWKVRVASRVQPQCSKSKSLAIAGELTPRTVVADLDATTAGLLEALRSCHRGAVVEDRELRLWRLHEALRLHRRGRKTMRVVAPVGMGVLGGTLLTVGALCVNGTGECGQSGVKPLNGSLLITGGSVMIAGAALSIATERSTSSYSHAFYQAGAGFFHLGLSDELRVENYIGAIASFGSAGLVLAEEWLRGRRRPSPETLAAHRRGLSTAAGRSQTTDEQAQRIEDDLARTSVIRYRLLRVLPLLAAAAANTGVALANRSDRTLQNRALLSALMLTSQGVLMLVPDDDALRWFRQDNHTRHQFSVGAHGISYQRRW